MLRYLRRARAISATVARLEGEVRELQDSLRAAEAHAERTRLETLAAERRMQACLEQVEKAATGMFDYLRLARGEADARPARPGAPR